MSTQRPSLSIFHRFLEFVWNPGIILFDDEFGHCGPLHWRQRLNLFNDFLWAHAFCYYTQNDWLSKGLLASEILDSFIFHHNLVLCWCPARIWYLGPCKNNFETTGVILTFSKERQCQKNGVGKMKLPASL
jgi:hypothetical protein